MLSGGLPTLLVCCLTGFTADMTYRHPDAFEARSIDPERLENDPVWKLGYYEGSEKLANLM